MEIPTEIYDYIAHHVWNIHNTQSMFPGYTSRHFCVTTDEVRRDLAALRLVNKAFCRSASRWLFMHINAKSKSRTLPIPPLTRISRISQSPYAFHVRQIDFGYTEDDGSYVEDLSATLSDLLVKFPNLAALEFDGPGLPRPPSSLLQAQETLYMDTIASVLHYVPLPNLKELVIRLSVTQDSARFFPERPSPSQIPLGDIFRRLRYLALCNDEEIWYARSTPAEPAGFPEDTFTSSFFRMAEAASNLESLSIQSLDVLDVDVLASSLSLRLRSLYLLGVSISSSILLQLIDTDSAQELSDCDLCLVRLKSGTWPEVFLQMLKLPRLVEFCIHLSSCAPTNPNSQLVLRQPVDAGHSSQKTAANDPDNSALRALLEHVNSNRLARGIRPYDDTEYRTMPRRYMA